MTYEEAMTGQEEDPFAEIFAWLQIKPMETSDHRVVMIVKPHAMLATVVGFNADNYEDVMQRASTPDMLTWDAGDLMISPGDKRNSNWHRGTQQQLTEWAGGLFK